MSCIQPGTCVLRIARDADRVSSHVRIHSITDSGDAAKRDYRISNKYKVKLNRTVTACRVYAV